MFCLWFNDEADRVSAMGSLARRCQGLGGRLVVLGAPVDPANAQLRRSSDLGSIEVRPRSLTDVGWAGLSDAVCAALDESLSRGGHTVLWIEPGARVAEPGEEAEFQRYREFLAGLRGRIQPAVVHAFRAGEIPAETLLARASCVVNAAALLPECPWWVLQPRRSTSEPGQPQEGNGHHADAELRAAEALFSERLVAFAQIAAGVAHELGNPLSIISSSLQYLHERLAEVNDPATDFTSTALQNVDRMHGLLRRMLDFAATKRSTLQEIDLHDTILGVLRFTADECARRAIHVEVTFDRRLLHLWADPSGMTQIFLNLVTNALDALAVSGDRLSLRTRAVNGGAAAVIEIENNGPAIAPDVLARLFRPFHTTKPRGTGLGLYLSQQIAREHGGDLAVMNLSPGVRFTLTLPALAQDGDRHGACTDRR